MKAKDTIKLVIGGIIIVGSIVAAAYVGIWEMFIGPIIEACKAFDAGTLTGLIVGKTVIKCIFASTVSGLILWIGPTIGLKVMK
jgi:hypothetical protein